MQLRKCFTGILVAGVAVAQVSCGGGSPRSAASASGAAAEDGSAPGNSRDSSADGYPDGWPEQLRMPDDARITSHLTLHGAAGIGTRQLMVTARIEDGSGPEVYRFLASEVRAAGFEIARSDTTANASLFIGHLTGVRNGRRESCLVSVNAIGKLVTIKATVGHAAP
jgi:hypothetical protein